MKVTVAIILAGGLGTRLRGTVPGLPKPMAPINGRPFLEYLMDYWIEQGISRFILSIGYLSQMIIDHFGKKYRETSIDYIIEESPLGTGGGLLMSAKGLTEPFLVLNGDTFFEVDLKDLTAFHEKNKSGWTISLFSTTNLERYMSIEITKTGKILKMKVNNNQSSYLVNGGVYLINPSILKDFKELIAKKISLEDEILSECVSSGQAIYGLECFGGFIDIGVPEDYHLAQTFFLNNKS